MKRILLSLVMTLGLVVSIAPNANADYLKFPCGGAGTYTVQRPEGIAVWSSDCTGILIIDDSVKIIGPMAFELSKLTSVTIPNSVTTIGEKAFWLSTLTSVTIGNSVTSIGDEAFYNLLVLSKLTSLTIGNSVTSIGAWAFSGNSLTSLVIPNSVTSIGAWAFYGNKLTSLVIPNSVTSIGESAFSNGSGIRLKSLTLGNSVTSIGASAFYGNQLTSLVIPNSVTSIGASAFNAGIGDSFLTSLIIGNSVTSIGRYAFSGEFLKTVTIPSSIEAPSYGSLIGDINSSFGYYTIVIYCGTKTVNASWTCPTSSTGNKSVEEILATEKAAVIEKAAADAQARLDEINKAAKDAVENEYWDTDSLNDGFAKKFVLSKMAKNQGYYVGISISYWAEIQCSNKKLTFLIYSTPLDIRPQFSSSGVGTALVKIDDGKQIKTSYLRMKDGSGVSISNPKTLTAAIIKGSDKFSIKISSTSKADTVANFTIGNLESYAAKFKSLGCPLK